MNKSLTLYIPSELSILRREYTKRMARRFGGATVVTGYGAWINSKDRIEFEDVSMITSYHNEDDQLAADVLTTQFAHDLRKAGEEAIFIVRNGEALIL